MRLPNGYGGVSKRKGNLRKPFRVRLTVGWEQTESGRQKQKYKILGDFATKKEALQALAKYHENPYDLTRQEFTFDDCYKAWTPKHFAEHPVMAASVKAAYKKCEPIKDLPIKNIRLKHLQDLMDTCAEMSVQSQNNLKTLFSKTFQYAMENDIVQKNYAEFVKIKQNAPKKDVAGKYFTKHELAKLMESDLPMADASIILLHTGVRIGELLSLKCEDIDLTNRIIHLHGTKTKAADRLVPIHRDIVQLIAARLGGEYLIEDKKRGGKMTVSKFRNSFFAPIMEDIGAKHTPHALRHTFISIMDACGVPASSVVLKRIVGHANSTITEHYTHKDAQELVLAIDKFNLGLEKDDAIPLPLST